jgi:hypothetical protein
VNETIQIAQLVSTTALAICSAIIATAACFVAYRQAYGFEPLIVLSSTGVSGGGSLEKGNYIAVIKAGIWNRRKYVIRVNGISLIFYSSIINESAKGFSKKDKIHYSACNTVWFMDEFNLEPGQHKELEFEAPIKVPSLDRLNERAIIKFSYFDPISGKFNEMTLPIKYMLNSLYEGAKEIKYG